MKPLEANTFVDVPDLKCPECGEGVQVAIDSWGDDGEPHSFSVQCVNGEGEDDPANDDECDECGGAGFNEPEPEDRAAGSDGTDCDLCGGSGQFTGHRYYWSDWQPIVDAAEAWARAQGFRVPT